MARDGRNAEQIRREIETERAELVVAVADLRASVDETTARLRAAKAKVPVLAAGATAAALVVTSAVGAVFRLVSGRREDTDDKRVKVGRWSIRLHDDED